LDQARRGDDLIGRVASKIEATQSPHYFQRQWPDVDIDQKPIELGVVEVDLDSFELGKLGKLPENDGGNAPASPWKNGCGRRGQLSAAGIRFANGGRESQNRSRAPRGLLEISRLPVAPRPPQLKVARGRLRRRRSDVLSRRRRRRMRPGIALVVAPCIQPRVFRVVMSLPPDRLPSADGADAMALLRVMTLRIIAWAGGAASDSNTLSPTEGTWRSQKRSGLPRSSRARPSPLPSPAGRGRRPGTRVPRGEAPGRRPGDYFLRPGFFFFFLDTARVGSIRPVRSRRLASS
jgi:hypothetical protein